MPLAASRTAHLVRELLDTADRCRVAADPERHLDVGVMDELLLPCRAWGEWTCREVRPELFPFGAQMPADEPSIRFRPRTDTSELYPSQRRHTAPAPTLWRPLSRERRELFSSHFRFHYHLAKW